MNLKLVQTIRVFMAFIVLSYGNIGIAKASEEWENLYLERFEPLEQFFLRQGCLFYQGAAYLYDLDKGHWLTYDEAASHHPELADTLTNVECTLSATIDELSQLISIESFNESGLILLYFDVARDESGDNRSIFTVRMRENYQRKLDRLSEFDMLPKYRIIPPRSGGAVQ